MTHNYSYRDTVWYQFTINCDLKKLWSQWIIVGNFFYIYEGVDHAYYLPYTWPLFQVCITGAGVETVYIVPLLPYSSYVYTYFKSQIGWIHSTLQISTVTKSITGSYTGMCYMTSNELPDKARGHKITQLINLYQVKATSPTPKYLYWCSHVSCKPISC